MDKDRVAGAADQAKDAVKGVGNLNGDTRMMQPEGQAEKAKGKVQNAVGSTKDAARDALDKD
jgi:uncharacterized protein YjbJ (UPF0337 family)